MAEPTDPVPMRLMARGGEFQNTLTTDAAIKAFLADIGVAEGPGTLRARLERAANGRLAKGKGLGGVQVRDVLRAVVPTTSQGNGRFRGALSQTSVSGRIVEFYFKPGETMTMAVEMTTTTQGPGGERSFAERYHVEIPAGSARVEARNDAAPGNVFPEFGAQAFAIPASMAEKTVNGTTVKFEYKLWSVGEAVRVTEYRYKNLNVPNPVWAVYRPTDPGLPAHVRDIFEADEKACVDMMFVRDPAKDVAAGGALANGHLPAGSAPPYYCLGRCTNPPIVNTR